MTEMTKNWFKPKQNMTKVMQIKMTNDQYNFMVFAHKKLNMSFSEIIRCALIEYFDKHL